MTQLTVGAVVELKPSAPRASAWRAEREVSACFPALGLGYSEFSGAHREARRVWEGAAGPDLPPPKSQANAAHPAQPEHLTQLRNDSGAGSCAWVGQGSEQHLALTTVEPLAWCLLDWLEQGVAVGV